jgi:hypothetical protein
LQGKSAPFRAAGSEHRICSRGFLLCGTYPLGGAFVFSASDHASSLADYLHRLRSNFLERSEDNMNTTTLLIIIVLLLVLGGGGFYGRGRWY